MSKAQFMPAAIPQTTYQKNPGPTPFYQIVENTGNDLLVETVNNITYEMSVTVWDGFTPAMGWKYIDNTGTYTSIVDLPTEVRDPDSKQIMCIAFEHADVNAPLHRFCASFYAHNSDGRAFTDPPFPQPKNYNFYAVPTNTNEHTYAISVAGEMSESFIYSFANFTNQSVQYKTVASFAHLRKGNFMTAATPTPKSVLLYDNFTPMFFTEIESDMTWADSQGKVICNDISNANEVLQTLKPGITFINYKTHEGYTQQIKLIKL